MGDFRMKIDRETVLVILGNTFLRMKDYEQNRLIEKLKTESGNKCISLPKITEKYFIQAWDDFAGEFQKDLNRYFENQAKFKADIKRKERIKKEWLRK